jgi:hypothetical protein
LIICVTAALPSWEVDVLFNGKFVILHEDIHEAVVRQPPFELVIYLPCPSKHLFASGKLLGNVAAFRRAVGAPHHDSGGHR